MSGRQAASLGLVVSTFIRISMWRDHASKTRKRNPGGGKDGVQEEGNTVLFDWSEDS